MVIVLALKRPDSKHKDCYQWLIANGQHMGKWTSWFGVHCLADMLDNKEYIQLIHSENPGYILETYTLTQER